MHCFFKTGSNEPLQEQAAFKCTVCPYKDKRKSKLARHMKVYHSEAKEKVRCAPDCSFEYWPERTWELNRHRKPGGKCTR